MGIYSNIDCSAYSVPDFTFMNQKQFSEIATSSTFLWLNKEQIKNGFYFKIQVEQISGQFKMRVVPKNYIELNLYSSTYIYHVTEKNQNYVFIIKGEKEQNPIKNNTIIIWAYGNKDIKTNLNISDYKKHSKYNSYIIKPNEYNEYMFSVNAKIGDIINVGFINLIQENKLNICTNWNNVLGIYKGLLKRNILENICFPQETNLNYLYIKYIDTNMNVEHVSDQIYDCIILPEKMDELFFSFHYLHEYYTYNIHYDDYSLYVYHSLLKGIYYYGIIEPKTKKGYLPLRIEDDFNYLTYYIISKYPDKKFKIYFYMCENYPSCSLIQDDLQNYNIPINQYLNTFTITLSRKEFDFNILSKKRRILFIECLEENANCIFYINIYTDKTKIYQGSKTKFDSSILKEPNIQYKYITNKTTDNILIKPKIDFGYFSSDDYDNPFFNIEKIYGDILLDSNKNVLNNYNNIYNYKLNSIDEYINLNIKSNRNSLYSIKYYHLVSRDDEKKFYLPIGGQFLIDLENNTNTIIKFYHSYEEYGQIFVNIYPIDCEIEVKLEDNDLKKYYFDGVSFYQNI